MAALANDDVKGLRQYISAAGEPKGSRGLPEFSAGGDMVDASTRDHSVLDAAVQCGSLVCARFLLANGANVGTAEVRAAFRGGNREVLRLLWDAFPYAKPMELALEAARSWNATGLRWLLARKAGALPFHDLSRLFKAACLSGSCSCALSVIGSALPPLRNCAFRVRSGGPDVLSVAEWRV
jgi:hypothetical protein